MNRKAQMVIAGAGTAAGIYGISRAIGRKRINTLPYGYGIKIKKAITVSAQAERLYLYWRNLQNLPRLFDDFVAVRVDDDIHSHWTLHAPGGMLLEWDAEITIDRPNEMVGWRSLEGADIANAGYVRFEKASGGRGTVVRVALQYNPPAGKFGAAISTVLGERPEGLIEEALRKFRQLMETGEIPTALSKKKMPRSPEPVEMASEDSFPASDPPAWTGTSGPIG